MLSFTAADVQAPPVRLGKVKAPLPPEYALALFIKDIENPHSTWSANTSACEWFGVSCNEARKPIHYDYVTFQFFGPFLFTEWRATTGVLRGQLSWAHLPDSVERLSVPRNDLSGGISVKDLPRSMLALILFGNQFSGELDLEALPGAIGVLDVKSNNLEGFVNMDRLPAGLLHLNLSNNFKLRGVCRESLLPRQSPQDVCYVDIGGTAIRVE